MEREPGRATVVLGAQWGDEGKGGHTARLAFEHSMIARYNGGSNAGHTFMYNGIEINTHQVPSGILYPNKLNISANGVLMNPVPLFDSELPELRKAGIRIDDSNYRISHIAALVGPHDILLDKAREMGDGKQGSTVRGISYAAANKYGRENFRTEQIIENPGQLMKDVVGAVAIVEAIGIDVDGVIKILQENAQEALEKEKETGRKGDTTYLNVFSLDDMLEQWWESAKLLQPYLDNTAALIHSQLSAGETLLAEGAQGIGLDIEMGIQPLGSSSHVGVGGALNGLQIRHDVIDDVYGIAKIPMTRVGGNGYHFPGQIDEETIVTGLAGKPEDPDGEFGKSTGRGRKHYWHHIPALVSAVRYGGVTEFILTKLDKVENYGPTMKMIRSYMLDGVEIDYLPPSAAQFERCEPVYEEYETWSAESVENVRDFDDFPEATHRVLDAIHKYTGKPVTVAGVGYQSDRVAFRKAA